MSLNPLGFQAPSVRTLPANKSLVVADSVYRDVSNQNERPFDFTCKLNGTALVGNEIYYQRLYWNQPLYAHNNTNSELRFQINGDTTTTYVVYATPFLMFTQYDGNAPGTSFLPPQLYSYASNMELALNGDVRNLTSNLIPINALSGILKDANGFTMTAQFRYSPSKGFVFTFAASINPAIPVYTLRLLPCSFIARAHYVHGFGIVTPASPLTFVPRDAWTVAYFSDDTPNLLPLRYITITSQELNKDRRLISFQNATSTKFVNELAVFPLNPAYTGAYHTELAGEDGTVISKRDDYNPQSFRITISGENGEALQCGDVLGDILSDESIYPAIIQSFLFGARANRGDYFFTNIATFGLGSTNYSLPTFAEFSLNSSNVNVGMTTFQRLAYTGDLFSVYPNSGGESKYGFPVIVTNTTVPASLGNYLGLGNSVSLTPNWTHDSNPVPPSTVGYQSENQSRFTYTPSQNPNPAVSFDATIQKVAQIGAAPNVCYFWVGLWSYTINNWISGKAFSASSFFFNVVPGTPSFTFHVTDSPLILETNPSVSSSQLNQPHSIGVFIVPFGYGPGVDYNSLAIVITVPAGGKFRWYNLSPRPTAPGVYVPPVIELGGSSSSGLNYPFGNPQADGLCEDLIHELVTISKNN